MLAMIEGENPCLASLDESVQKNSKNIVAAMSAEVFTTLEAFFIIPKYQVGIQDQAADCSTSSGYITEFSSSAEIVDFVYGLCGYDSVFLSILVSTYASLALQSEMQIKDVTSS
jgi:hypothetical protein